MAERCECISPHTHTHLLVEQFDEEIARETVLCLYLSDDSQQNINCSLVGKHGMQNISSDPWWENACTKFQMLPGGRTEHEPWYSAHIDRNMDRQADQCLTNVLDWDLQTLTGNFVHIVVVSDCTAAKLLGLCTRPVVVVKAAVCYRCWIPAATGQLSSFDWHTLRPSLKVVGCMTSHTDPLEPTSLTALSMNIPVQHNKQLQ